MTKFDDAGNVTDTLRLTTHAAGDAQPAISPDGRRIAFASSRDGGRDFEIYVMKANIPEGPTNRPIRLTDNTASDWKPDWSSSGKKIVFQSYRAGNYEVFVMNSDGSQQRNLTKNAAEDGDPVFSPDGKKLALQFAADRSCAGRRGDLADAGGGYQPGPAHRQHGPRRGARVATCSLARVAR